MDIQTTESAASANWMEHHILQHIKEALRVTVEWQAPAVSMPRKLSSVRFTLRSFQRHLERLMNLEEEGGYLAQVVQDKPNLQSRVAALEGDHDRLRGRLQTIVPRIEEMSEWQEEHFNSLCREIVGLLEDVDRHDAEEIDLLQDALCSDEGGEG